MLRIRLRRVGKRGKPSYRIVVAEAKAPRDGAYLEWIGNYDPMTDPPSITLKTDRANDWLSKGAQPSDAVKRILEWDEIRQQEPAQEVINEDSPQEAASSDAASSGAVAVAEAPPEASPQAPEDSAPAAETE